MITQSAGFFSHYFGLESLHFLSSNLNPSLLNLNLLERGIFLSLFSPLYMDLLKTVLFYHSYFYNYLGLLTTFVFWAIRRSEQNAMFKVNFK